MIFNIQRFSLHDGDGIRTVVFLKGCPLRCAWCSNPESQSFSPEFFFDPAKCIGCRDCVNASQNGEITWSDGPAVCRGTDFDAARFAALCPTEALTVAGEEKSVGDILDAVERDRVFYRGKGGLTLSGGEPFAQPELTRDILAEAKSRGLSTGVETCLAVPWKNVEPSLPLLDSVYADVKHVDAKKYRDGTGGDVAVPLDNLRRLAETDTPVVARVPVVPGFNDAPEELDAIAGFVASLGNITRLHLMPYHSYGEGKYQLLNRPYPLAGVPSTPPESLEPVAARLAGHGLDIRIGG